MKTARNNGFAWFATVLFPHITLALAASLAIASCAQDVKITAPRYALVYGIRNYPGNINDLNYTVNDANSMRDTLVSQGWSVNESTDSSAIKSNIISDFASMSSISSGSILLFYYSGHGTVVGNSAVLIPYDGISATNIGQPNESATIVPSKLITPTDLFNLISTLPTKNVIVILDSCYSGGFVSSGSSIDASPPDYSLMPGYSAFSTAMSNFGSLLATNASASGAKTPIVISAAGLAEFSWETNTLTIPPDTGHGVFTYYLLQSATNGDSDGDGFVTMTEAYAYTVSSMKSGWDSNPSNVAFLPHLSGGTRDLVLFTK